MKFIVLVLLVIARKLVIHTGDYVVRNTGEVVHHGFRSKHLSKEEKRNYNQQNSIKYLIRGK